jgi:hypothetical protein
VPKGAAANTDADPVLRVNFTTSRFASATELADLVRLSAVEHRFVANAAPLAGLAERPSGAQLDVAFQQAGLGVPQVPRYPRVQVLWSGDAVPQPKAVVVECSEAMWRGRPMPAQVPAPPDAVDPTHKWWAAVPSDWLSLAPHAGTPAAGDPPVAAVTRLVHGPGGTRAVALLGPGARGAEVRLDLVLAADPLSGDAEARAEAVRVKLVRAPWEVDD